MQRNKKILVIEASLRASYGEDYVEDCDVSYREITSVDELLVEVMGLINSDLHLKQLLENKMFRTAMEKAGFRHIDDLKKLKEHAIYEPTVMIKNEWGTLSLINLADLERHGQMLASPKTFLLQPINKECLKEIAPDAYAAMKKQLDANAKRAKSIEATKKAKEAGQREKKIKEAKKLLAEAGVKQLD